jgi:diaminopimelate epimerase
VAVIVDGPGRVRAVYRNADGGRARFCANATRCAARVAVESLGLDSPLVVATAWGPIPAEVRGSEVSLELMPAGEPPRRVALEVEGRQWQGWWMELGVPHVVIDCDDLDGVDLAHVGPLLRSHPELGAEGANVNLVTPGNDGQLRIRSFERGVEAETLSCASGIVAAALIAMAASGSRSLRCLSRSGDVLTVEALASPPLCATRLTAATRIVAEVEPSDELLRQ